MRPAPGLLGFFSYLEAGVYDVLVVFQLRAQMTKHRADVARTAVLQGEHHDILVLFQVFRAISKVLVRGQTPALVETYTPGR